MNHTKVILKRNDGDTETVVFEIEAIEFNSFVGESQIGLQLSNPAHCMESQKIWPVRLASIVNQKLGCEITPTEAFCAAQKCDQIIKETLASFR